VQDMTEKEDIEIAKDEEKQTLIVS